MYRDENWYNPNLFISEVSRTGQLRNTLTKQLGESGVLRVEVRHECYRTCKIHFFQLGGIHQGRTEAAAGSDALSKSSAGGAANMAGRVPARRERRGGSDREKREAWGE